MNNSFLTLNSMVPIWPILLLVLIIGLFFVWGEVRRKSRLLPWRITAQAVVLMSLLGLFLHPSIRLEKSTASILLLTNGYDRKIADSLLAANPFLQLFRTQDANDFNSSDVLPSYTRLRSLGSSIRFVVGEGLPDQALSLILEKNFHYYPAQLPAGVITLYLSPFHVNQQNALNGEFNSTAGRGQLQLIGPGGIEDSVELKGKGVIPFSLLFVPRQPGKFMYSLTFRDSRGFLHPEKLPLEILPEKKLRISFLQQYPTFETRYLKNYLSAGGHSLQLRYQVSKDLYRDEFINVESGKTAHSTTDLFRWSDLLFIDEATLLGLTTTENHFLEEAIHSGLGIIILFDKSPKGKSYLPFIVLSPDPLAPDRVTINLRSEKISLPSLPFRLEPQSDINSVRNANGKVMSGFRHLGVGKVGFQFLQETYSLILKGQDDTYAEIWSPIIEQVAREKNDSFKIKISSPFPHYANEPISVEIISSNNTPTLFADSIRIPLIEDVSIDNLWHGKLWPGRVGWHSLLIPEDSTSANFYVSNHPEWSSLSLAHQLRLNRVVSEPLIPPGMSVKIINLPSPSLPTKKKYANREVSPLVFFFLFILGSGFLWLAPKM